MIGCVEFAMFERFFSTSKVAFGAPHTFGWVRCSALDAKIWRVDQR